MMDISQLQPSSLLVVLSVLSVLWTLYGAIYRLYLHPLRKFPGPTLAKLTYWYEFYYDCILDGKFTSKLKELHEQYGPALRHNPDELHINDPDYYDEVFSNSKNVEKPYKEANKYGPFMASIATMSHDLHRIRRGGLNHSFSKRSVYELSPYVQMIVDRLCRRLEHAATTGGPINLKYAYSALTTDVINEYCFSTDSARLGCEDFDQRGYDNIDGFVLMSVVNYHLPWLMRSINALPDRLAKLIFPKTAETIDYRQSLSEQVEAIRNGGNDSRDKSGHRTIFHDLLESGLPSSEKSKIRLRDEAFSVVVAGSSTTAHVLKTTTYHISANRQVQDKLHKELLTIMPKPKAHVDLQQLEKLPYLTAVILEGLRTSHAVPHRFARAYPDKIMWHQGLAIPPGTGVHMSFMLVHENESIYPEPGLFKPERWLGSGQQHLQKYLVAFARGTRGCVGLNLAWAELYLTLASVFRCFDFDLSDVVRERDIDCARSLILGMPKPESKGVIVQVVPVQD